MTAHENHSHYHVMVVCCCANINEKKLNQAIEQGFNTEGALAEELNVGVCCGSCLPEVRSHLHKSINKEPVQA